VELSLNIASVEKDTKEKEEIAEMITVQSDHKENGCTPDRADPDCYNDCDVNDDESSTQIARCENSISQTNVTQTSGRRDLIAYIQDQRNGKMKKKLPADKVMIDLTKEDLQLKREIVKHLKETDSDQKEQLKVMTETVGTLAKSISDGFSALTSYLNQPHRYPLRPIHHDSLNTPCAPSILTLGTTGSDSQRLVLD
jgi:hypothetical protein